MKRLIFLCQLLLLVVSKIDLISKIKHTNHQDTELVKFKHNLKMMELLELRKQYLPQERELIEEQIKTISNENIFRFNPKYKLTIDASARYKFSRHSPKRDSDKTTFDKKFDKRAFVQKKINPDQMQCYIHLKPFPIHLWKRLKLVNMKLMFYSNCMKGPKIFYLYQNNQRELPFMLNLSMINNMYVMEFDGRSMKYVNQYNNYYNADKFKFHDFYHRSDLRIAQRPFDKINVERGLNLPKKPKTVNYSYYNLRDNSGSPDELDELKRHKNIMKNWKEQSTEGFWKSWKQKRINQDFSDIKYRHLGWKQAGEDQEIVYNKGKNSGYWDFKKVKVFWEKNNIVPCRMNRTRKIRYRNIKYYKRGRMRKKFKKVPLYLLRCSLEQLNIELLLKNFLFYQLKINNE